MTEIRFDIRPVKEGDFPEWLRLRRLLWDQAGEAEHRAEMLEILDDRESQLVIVAERRGGGLIGFLEASIRPFVEDCLTDHVGYLEGWLVEPEYRRRGIGGELVRAAEAWARSKGCIEMASDAEIGNETGLGAHLRLGYRETSRLVHLRKELV